MTISAAATFCCQYGTSGGQCAPKTRLKSRYLNQAVVLSRKSTGASRARGLSASSGQTQARYQV